MEWNVQMNLHKRGFTTDEKRPTAQCRIIAKRDVRTKLSLAQLVPKNAKKSSRGYRRTQVVTRSGDPSIRRKWGGTYDGGPLYRGDEKIMEPRYDCYSPLFSKNVTFPKLIQILHFKISI